jgi:hypothetical protein
MQQIQARFTCMKQNSTTTLPVLLYDHLRFTTLPHVCCSITRLLPETSLYSTSIPFLPQRPRDLLVQNLRRRVPFILEHGEESEKKKEKDRILLLPARPPFIERNEGIAFDDLIRQISPLQQLGGRNDVKDGSKQSARAGMAACVSFFQAQIASDRPLFLILDLHVTDAL